MRFTIPARCAARERPETSVSATQVEDGVQVEFAQSSYYGHIRPDDVEVHTKVVDSHRIVVTVRRK